MTSEDKRYRVTAEYRSVHQLIIEATSQEEAEYFANDIDLDKWKFIDVEYEIVDVAKDFFERKQMVDQDTEVRPSNEGPTLKIVN